jgi:tetratricopeptide (TPR) repeat protein
MKEPEPAQEYLVEALSQDPAHVPSMLSLLGIYRRRGDWMKAGAAHGPRRGGDRSTRSRRRACSSRPARSSRTSWATTPRRPSSTRASSSSTPSTSRRASRCPELYFRREDWAPLVPILEMLARKADRKTNRELTLLNHRLAKAADKLGDNDKALKYYKQSYDLDSTYLPTLVDRACAPLQAGALG